MKAKNRILKKLVCVYFDIGVNIIGLPIFHKHIIPPFSIGGTIQKSNYHK